MREETDQRLSNRRVALSVLRQGVRAPSRLPHRINRTNLERWNAFRRVEASCPVCGHRGTLVYELPDLDRLERHRGGVLGETLRCRGCTAKMSGRALGVTLLEVLAERGVHATTVDSIALPPDVQVLAVDAHNRLAARVPRRPGFIRAVHSMGREVPGDLRPVDLERLSFPDGHFDVVLTSQVLEHVRHVDRAHREIARVLKPGGAHVFTVPYDPTLEHTWQLIDPVTDALLVDPPHVHGDPLVSGDGVKSYRVFGRDLLDHLREAGLTAHRRRVDRPELGIFDGGVFLACKQPVEPAKVPEQGGPAAWEAADPHRRRLRTETAKRRGG